MALVYRDTQEYKGLKCFVCGNYFSEKKFLDDHLARKHQREMNR
jgi:hypothetical protein